MITRTVSSLKCYCLVYNAATQKTSNTILYLLSGEYKEDVLNALRKRYESDGLKVVQVYQFEEVSKKYGMTLSDFIDYADPIDGEDNDGEDNDDEGNADKEDA